MIKTILTGYLLLQVITITAQQKEWPKLTGPYLGQKLPGNTPELFAPGIVSREGIQTKINISPDGSEFVFCEREQNTNKARFITIKKIDGKWTEPAIIPFSTEFMNDEPVLSPDGKKLYFVSNRPINVGGAEQKMPDICTAEKTKDGWGNITNLGAPVNTDGVEVQPFLSTDNKLYFGRMEGLYYSNIKEGKYSQPVKMEAKVFKERVSGICVSPKNDVLIVHSRMAGGLGSWDLYISFKDKEGNWGELRNMGNVINSAGNEANASFTPDGKYLFFSRDGDIYWISAKIIEDLRPKE